MDSEELKLLYTGLWAQMWRSAPYIERGFVATEDTEVADVVEWQYGTCPESGVALYRYGTQCLEGVHVAECWLTDRKEAQRLNDELRAYVARVREYEQNREALEEAEDLFYTACRPAGELEKSALFRYAESLLSKDSTLITNFWEARGYKIPERGDMHARPGDVLNAIEILELATKQLQDALESMYIERLEFADKHSLAAKLQQVLKVAPQCPMCGGRFSMVNNTTEELLVFGEARPQCKCPEGWNTYDEPASSAPWLVQQMHKRQWDIGRFGRQFAIPLVIGTSNGLPLFEMRQGNTVLLHVVAGAHNLRHFPVFVVNTSGLAAYDPHLRVQVVDTWKPMLEAVDEAVYQNAERESQDGSGLTMKLRFTWDNGRQCFSIRRREGDGIIRVYRVDGECSFPVINGTEYFCRIRDRFPDKDGKPFELVIVRPYLKVRPDTTAISRRHPPVRDPNRGSSRGGHPGFGTFADLLRDTKSR